MISRPSAVVPSSRSPDGRREQLLDLLRRQLVRREVLRDRGALAGLAFAALQVRAVPADAHDDARPVERDRVHPARVDLFQPRLDEPLQPALRRDALRVRVRVVGAEVEPAQPVHPRALAVGDVVQVVLDRGGEAVVDQTGEVGLEQADDRERRPRRHHRGALLEDVTAVLDRLHDRGVGGRPADAEFLHRLDQRRLGEARRRAGVCPSASKPRASRPSPRASCGSRFSASSLSAVSSVSST